MDDVWFALYHLYSTACHYDEKGLQNFEADLRYAQKLGIKILIMEDYYSNFLWGEYTNLWDASTFRGMIKLVHDYGIRFLPYMDVTELAIHGDIWKSHGKSWGAKNSWGKPYSAFSSIFLPQYYKRNFHTKLMCPHPSSGWGDYLTEQTRRLLGEYEIDGIYLDRVDYRVRCFAHSPNPNHFIEGIPLLVSRIRGEVKSVSAQNLLILNDSCVNPDSTLQECLKLVDFVLTELLPTDTNPRSFYWQFIVNWGDLIWGLRWIFKPILKVFMPIAFTTGMMTDESRLQYIIDRLKPYVGQNIILFSHRRDRAGFRAIRQIAKLNQLRCGYLSGLKYLRNIEYYLEP
jgi:hypothetical protein